LSEPRIVDGSSATGAPPRERETFADPRDIDTFVAQLRRFEQGAIDADAWRAFRVGHGAYSQRQDGVHMLRIKIPQGIATAAQLRALAEVAARYSRGYGHVTTRQNFQLHFVRPADLEPALRRLAEAGITTSGSGGNQVRNVVACALAGVGPDEIFDPTPYAEALTRYFLRHPLGSSLPRKFKVAFEGCGADHVGTSIQDIGFRARIRDGARGFAVAVAGGTSSACTSGALLADFLPAGDVLTLAEAIVRVFHARGDRANKHRNRLKFLVRDLGFDAFRALVHEELARIHAEGAPRLPFDPERPPREEPPAAARPPAPAPAEIAARVAAAPPRGPGEPPPVTIELEPGPAALPAFLRTNVRSQRQPGFSVVTVAAPQGDVTAAQLEVLADLALAHGDGTVRFTSRGHAALRWIPEGEIGALFGALAAAGLHRDGAGSAGDVVACPGADACRLAVTRTHGVARLVEEHVRKALGDSALDVPLPVHVSGCPNGCSQHHLAAIGLQGSARKLGARAVPQYFVLVGGGADDGGARFGKLAGKVPSRRVPEVVERLVSLYLAERADGEPAGAFFARAHDRARSAVGSLQGLRLEDARAEDFVEPGSTEDFRPATQDGECAA
jgi:sulfite reductase beta subunit-like hemoprotein